MNTTTPSPRSSTTARDIVATVRARDLKAAADAAALDAQRALSVAIRAAPQSSTAAAAEEAVALYAARTAHAASEEAHATLMRVPRARRDAAAKLVEETKLVALDALRTLGGIEYSGETRRIARWSDGSYDPARCAASASTATQDGDRYSRSSKYHKTDAVHCVTLDPHSVSELVANRDLRLASSWDRLPLIALRPDGRATWLRRDGNSKRVVAEHGWIAGDGPGRCYHSTVSAADAAAGLARKVAAQAKAAAVAQALAEARQLALPPEERARLAQVSREARRASLLARISTQVTASESDARAIGYCTPGIAAFRAQYGITADRVSLADLCRTGDRQAIALAIVVARRAAAAARSVAVIDAARSADAHAPASA